MEQTKLLSILVCWGGWRDYLLGCVCVCVCGGAIHGGHTLAASGGSMGGGGGDYLWYSDQPNTCS